MCERITKIIEFYQSNKYSRNCLEKKNFDSVKVDDANFPKMISLKWLQMIPFKGFSFDAVIIDNFLSLNT